MKKNRLFTVVGIVIALCIAIALYMFVSPKSTKNIPELSSIAQMEEAKVNQLIVGYSINQLIEVWGEPDISGNNEVRWQLNTTATLVVNTNNKGKVVICGILQQAICYKKGARKYEEIDKHGSLYFDAIVMYYSGVCC